MKMGNIEKIHLINRTELREDAYFTSLMEKACEKGLMSQEDIQKIQLSCLELLATRVERYTGGDSSSVPVKIAESIMKSNLYTIGVYLKTFQNPDEAVSSLKEEDISKSYERGRKQIDIKLKSAKHLHQIILNRLPDIKNYTYNATVVEGIQGFFKIYNPDFEAHEIHITCDYPLCHPILELEGIEFIDKYLRGIYYENMFCNYFSSENIHHLFCGYHENYYDLIFNIFEQVLIHAIGCTLVKTDVFSLSISRSQVQQIYMMLSEKTKDETEGVIMEAFQKLMEVLSIKDLDLKEYMEKSILSIAANVFHTVQIDRLEGLFVPLKYPEFEPKFEFFFGEKMEDEKYRKIVNEILQCRFSEDKIAIIKREIKSLADLEDLLLDAELSSEEISEVLKDLSIVEIAALIKEHPMVSQFEMSDLSQKEADFRLSLNQYMLSLPEEKQNSIMNITNRLILDYCD